MQQNAKQTNEIFSLAINTLEKLKAMSEAHDLEFQDTPQLTMYESAAGEKRLLCTARFYVGSPDSVSSEDGSEFKKN